MSAKTAEKSFFETELPNDKSFKLTMENDMMKTETSYISGKTPSVMEYYKYGVTEMVSYVTKIQDTYYEIEEINSENYNNLSYKKLSEIEAKIKIDDYLESAGSLFEYMKLNLLDVNAKMFGPDLGEVTYSGKNH